MIETNIELEATAAPFPSLLGLTETHLKLRKLISEEQPANPDLLDEINNFTRRGSATGAVLDSEDERRLVQSYLDYWVTVLYRAERTPADATLADFDAALAPHLDDSLCPYKGLNAFREDDREMFFGRQGLIESIVSHLKENNFLAVIGPSGSGKSSLVLAGVLPELSKGALDGSDLCKYLPPLVPGSNPLRNLALACKPRDVDTTQWVNEQIQKLKDDPFHLAKMLRESPVVIVVDQFEEIFTLCLDDNLRNAFVENLVNIIRDPKQKHILIVTLRRDYEDRIVSFPELIPVFEKGRVRVTPLASADLYQAIEEPAKRVGLKFEDGVVDALVKDILGETAGLPLLQFTLLRLWKLRDHNRITWRAYQSLGGARRALALTADEFYEKLFVEDQKLVKRILLRLARPSEGFEVTSNRVRRKSLNAAGDHPDKVNRALELLLRAGLVRLTRGEVPADDQIEVAHEALIRNWPTLVGWLEDERIRLRKRLRLTSAAEQWIELGKDPGALLAGSLLDEALEYKESQEPSQKLSDTEAEFVNASVAAIEAAEREKEEARKRELELAKNLAKRNWAYALVCAAVAFVAMLTAGFAFSQRRKAEVSWHSAQKSAAEATEARKVAEQKSQLAAEKSQLADEQRKAAESNAEDLRKTAIALKAAKDRAEAESKRARLAAAARIQAEIKLAKQKSDEDKLLAKAVIEIAQAVIDVSDGEGLQRDNKLDAALAKYEQGTKVLINFGMYRRAERALTRMAEIYHAQGKFDEEQKVRSEAEKLPRPMADFLRKNIAAKGVDLAIQDVRISRINNPNKYYPNEDELNSLGYEYLKEKQVREAIEVFRLNVELYPDSANVYDSLGEGYLNVGNNEEAFKHYRKALEIAIKTRNDDVAASANCGLAELNAKAGSNDEARKYYERALELATKSKNDYVGASSNYGLGQLSMKAGKKDEAREYYGKALELATKSDNGRVKTDATNALKKLGAT
ncbi:MAG TPA: tetratricopeptide repeat protein [Pyrinomonadaceae bacterium]